MPATSLHLRLPMTTSRSDIVAAMAKEAASSDGAEDSGARQLRAPGLEGVLRLVRSVSPAMMQDRSLARDIEAVHHLVAAGDIGRATSAQIPELHALRLA